jgi:hypothetical protein
MQETTQETTNSSLFTELTAEESASVNGGGRRGYYGRPRHYGYYGRPRYYGYYGRPRYYGYYGRPRHYGHHGW